MPRILAFHHLVPTEITCPRLALVLFLIGSFCLLTVVISGWY